MKIPAHVARAVARAKALRSKYDALADDFQRANRRAAWLLVEECGLSLAQAADLLGVTRARVQQLAREARLIEQGRREAGTTPKRG